MINLDEFEDDELYDVDVNVLYDEITDNGEDMVLFAGRLCTVLEFNTTLDSYFGGYIELVLKSATGEYRQRYKIIRSDW